MKLSQSELAEKAGLSSATIGRLERDETRWEFITDETFDKLTRVFVYVLSQVTKKGNNYILRFLMRRNKT